MKLLIKYYFELYHNMENKLVNNNLTQICSLQTTENRLVMAHSFPSLIK